MIDFAYRSLLATMSLSLMAAPVASAVAQAGDPPPKTRSVIVYGDDACPAATGDEIVVCARQPEGDRYRIPKRFRGRKAAVSPAGNAWANKARASDDAARTAAGVPNSCSAVGAAGMTGCFQQFQNQAAAAKQVAPNGDGEP